jgi:hypothetical protein
MIDVPFSVFVMEMNIAHFEAMLKLDMDDEQRLVVERLFVEAKHHLTTAAKKNSRLSKNGADKRSRFESII